MEFMCSWVRLPSGPLGHGDLSTMMNCRTRSLRASVVCGARSTGLRRVRDPVVADILRDAQTRFFAIEIVLVFYYRPTLEYAYVEGRPRSIPYWLTGESVGFAFGAFLTVIGGALLWGANRWRLQ